MSTIGENIQFYRELANMTKEQLAYKLRIGPSKIDKYETGELVPTKETLFKISTCLDIPASSLLNERKNKMLRN